MLTKQEAAAWGQIFDPSSYFKLLYTLQVGDRSDTKLTLRMTSPVDCRCADIST